MNSDVNLNVDADAHTHVDAGGTPIVPLNFVEANYHRVEALYKIWNHSLE